MLPAEADRKRRDLTGPHTTTGARPAAGEKHDSGLYLFPVRSQNLHTVRLDSSAVRPVEERIRYARVSPHLLLYLRRVPAVSLHVYRADDGEVRAVFQPSFPHQSIG